MKTRANGKGWPSHPEKQPIRSKDEGTLAQGGKGIHKMNGSVVEKGFGGAERQGKHEGREIQQVLGAPRQKATGRGKEVGKKRNGPDFIHQLQEKNYLNGVFLGRWDKKRGLTPWGRGKNL